MILINQIKGRSLGGFTLIELLPYPAKLSRRERRRSLMSFTLIELLVVIAIISILMTILLPALMKSKERAVSLQCLNQQKSICTVLQLYANDYNGIGLAPKTGGNPWIWTLNENGYLAGFNTESGDWTNFQCPRWPQDPSHHCDVYAIGTFRTADVDIHFGWWRYGRGDTQVTILRKFKTPSEQPAIIDSIAVTSSPVIQVYNMHNPFYQVHLRHFRKASMAFYDGSARMMDKNAITDIDGSADSFCEDMSYCDITY